MHSLLAVFTNLHFVVVTFLATFGGVGHAAPTDVYTPPLLTPKRGAVWIIGSQQTVTWYVACIWAHHCAFGVRLICPLTHLASLRP